MSLEELDECPTFEEFDEYHTELTQQTQVIKRAEEFLKVNQKRINELKSGICTDSEFKREYTAIMNSMDKQKLKSIKLKGKRLRARVRRLQNWMRACGIVQPTLDLPREQAKFREFYAICLTNYKYGWNFIQGRNVNRFYVDNWQHLVKYLRRLSQN